MLNTSNHESPDPFARIASCTSPVNATGEVPSDWALPFTQTLSPSKRMLLLESGPSRVAVRFGASVTLSTMEVVVGLRWNRDGVADGTDVSCHPEKPRVAPRFPRFSASLRLSVMVHEPLASVWVERFCAPFTDEVNDNQTVWLGRLKISSVGSVAKASRPSSTVVAPAPATGALMARGAVWLMLALSVRFKNPSNTTPSLET